MSQVKIVVFVPKTHTDIVRQAMGDAGAGKIGNYSHCSYSVDGVGRYRPTEGAKPFIGSVGKFEEVEEDIYLSIKKDLIMERSKLKEELNEMHEGTDVVSEVIRKTIVFAREAKDKWENGTIQDKKSILTLLGSNLVLKQKQLQIAPKTPFLLIKDVVTCSNPSVEANSRLMLQENSVVGG